MIKLQRSALVNIITSSLPCESFNIWVYYSKRDTFANFDKYLVLPDLR